jgi:hypothetical protein
VRCWAGTHHRRMGSIIGQGGPVGHARKPMPAATGATVSFHDEYAQSWQCEDVLRGGCRAVEKMPVECAGGGDQTKGRQ